MLLPLVLGYYLTGLRKNHDKSVTAAGINMNRDSVVAWVYPRPNWLLVCLSARLCVAQYKTGIMHLGSRGLPPVYVGVAGGLAPDCIRATTPR